MEPNLIQVGLLPSEKLVSLKIDLEGNYLDIPEGQTVVPLVKLDKPQHDSKLFYCESKPVWFEDRVERDWEILPLSPEEIAANNRRIYTKPQFWSRFTVSEKAAIHRSDDDYVIAIYSDLNNWQGEVWNDDIRIVQGMDYLEYAGILSAERKEEILS